jgi:hypothetical protein
LKSRPMAGQRPMAGGRCKRGPTENWRDGEGAGSWRKGWRWVRLHFTPTGHCRRQCTAPAHQCRTPSDATEAAVAVLGADG